MNDINIHRHPPTHTRTRTHTLRLALKHTYIHMYIHAHARTGAARAVPTFSPLNGTRCCLSQRRFHTWMVRGQALRGDRMDVCHARACTYTFVSCVHSGLTDGCAAAVLVALCSVRARQRHQQSLPGKLFPARHRRCMRGRSGRRGQGLARGVRGQWDVLVLPVWVLLAHLHRPSLLQRLHGQYRG
jgi:hypothetical protein